MRSELAGQVYPVLRRSLKLRDRLRQGESPSLVVEQSVLLRLLEAESEGRALVDYQGDRPALGGTSDQGGGLPWCPLCSGVLAR